MTGRDRNREFGGVRRDMIVEWVSGRHRPYPRRSNRKAALRFNRNKAQVSAILTPVRHVGREIGIRPRGVGRAVAVFIHMRGVIEHLPEELLISLRRPAN